MDKLMRILSELSSDIDFETEDALIDGGLLDSFDIVTLVAEIDDTFGIEIPAEALIPENFIPSFLANFSLSTFSSKCCT